MVEPSPEALMLRPFKKLWDRDKSVNKDKALSEFAYIYFMEDPRSDYQYITDRNDRAEEVTGSLGLRDWHEDAPVKEACELYRSFKPVSAGLLEDTRYFVNAFRKELRERSDSLSGLEIKELKEAMALAKQIPGLTKDLDDAEKTLNKDIMSELKARGSQTKSIFEDED